LDLDIPKELLNSFRVIVLSAYRIPDIERADKIFMDYVERGGIVVIEEQNLVNFDLFEVQSVYEDVPNQWIVIDPIGASESPTELKEFGENFRGVRYETDGELVLTGLSPTGEVIPLVQKISVGQGAIYWVCCNVGNHIDGKSDIALATSLQDFFEDEIGGYTSMWPTAFDAEIEQLGPSKYTITYDVEEATPIVFSFDGIDSRVLTQEDGTSVELFRFGQHGRQGAAVLPAGAHTLTFDTEGEIVALPILFVWGIGIIMFGSVVTFGWRSLNTDT